MLDYAKYSVLSYSRQSSEAVRIARLPFLHAHLRQLVVRKALNPFVSRFESEDGHTLMPHTMRGLHDKYDIARHDCRAKTASI